MAPSFFTKKYVMNKLQIIVAISIFSIFIASCASDTKEPPSSDQYGRAATPEQIIGYWKLIEWPNPKAIKVNPWPLPYQWFAFYEDGSLLSMMKSEDENLSASDLESIFMILRSGAPQYHGEEDFLIVENPNIIGYMEMWGMNLYEKDYKDLAKKGDLVMSLAGGDEGRPVYFRLLRKLK